MPPKKPKKPPPKPKAPKKPKKGGPSMGIGDFMADQFKPKPAK